ncbi:hypothetical protein PENSPDRAFT_92766 [Peniophora sp. CONT]|nr:hypothetical protein PENSPDRAFT_92766 [Peniophora sp. CONT]
MQQPVMRGNNYMRIRLRWTPQPPRCSLGRFPLPRQPVIFISVLFADHTERRHCRPSHTYNSPLARMRIWRGKTLGHRAARRAPPWYMRIESRNSFSYERTASRSYQNAYIVPEGSVGLWRIGPPTPVIKPGVLILLHSLPCTRCERHLAGILLNIWSTRAGLFSVTVDVFEKQYAGRKAAQTIPNGLAALAHTDAHTLGRPPPRQRCLFTLPRNTHIRSCLNAQRVGRVGLGVRMMSRGWRFCFLAVSERNEIDSRIGTEVCEDEDARSGVCRGMWWGC